MIHVELTVYIRPDSHRQLDMDHETHHLPENAPYGHLVRRGLNIGLVLMLVRHAMPELNAAVPPELWELGDVGRRGAVSLRDVVPGDAVLVSSTEPKARQTLEPSGPVVTDARFTEVERDEPYDGDFRARRRAYITGTDHPGWEPRAEVIARFDAGIRWWQARCGDQPVVVATHGMAMTLWLTTLGLPDPGAFWAQLRLPDVFEVNVATRRVTRVESTQLIQVR
jgi:broad specificity phosphatase PhoE